MDISKSSVIIATHSLVYGAPQALREYLINNNVAKLLFVAHPLLTDGTLSSVEIIKNGKSIRTNKNTVRTKIFLFNYFIEYFLTLNWVLATPNNFDLFIGVDPLNCAAGVILKKLGKVKKLIYYTIDYVPQRFPNRFLNTIYHWIDRVCLSSSDETWNVSPRIAKGREKVHRLSQKTYRHQKVVPVGVWFDKVKRLPFNKIRKHQLLFIGNLLEKQGVQLILEAIPMIIRKIPDFHFLIIGGGEYESTLRQKTINLKLNNYVTFTGWIKERSKLDLIMADSALAIAMYDKNKDTFTYYADPTKLKDYLSAGLPILLTSVPYNAHDIENNECGLIIDYDKQKIAKAVISIMKDSSKLEKYRKNTVSYIKQFDWKIIFDNVLNVKTHHE